MEECEQRFWTIAILHLFGGITLLFWFFKVTSPLDNPSAFDIILVSAIWLLASGASVAVLWLKGCRLARAILSINLIPATAGILWCYGIGGYIPLGILLALSVAAAVWSEEITPIAVGISAALFLLPDIETAAFVLLVMVVLSAVRAYPSLPVSAPATGIRVTPTAVRLASEIMLALVILAGTLKMVETLKILAGSSLVPNNVTQISTILAAIGGALLTTMAAISTGHMPIRGIIWLMLGIIGVLQEARWFAAIALAVSMWETQRAIPMSGLTGPILVGTDYTAIGSSMLMLGTGIPKDLSRGFMAFAPMETALLSATLYLLMLGLLASGILEIRRVVAG
jgi:hypothetical protein